MRSWDSLRGTNVDVDDLDALFAKICTAALSDGALIVFRALVAAGLKQAEALTRSYPEYTLRVYHFHRRSD